MATTTAPDRGLQGQTAEERAAALKSSDPKVKASGLSRADLRTALGNAGVIGAQNLRRDDAERLYVEHASATKSKPFPAYRCDAKGKVTKVTAATKAKAPAKRAPAKAKSTTKRAAPKGRGKAGSGKAGGAEAAPVAAAPAADVSTEQVGDATIAVDQPADAA